MIIEGPISKCAINTFFLRDVSFANRKGTGVVWDVKWQHMQNVHHGQWMTPTWKINQDELFVGGILLIGALRRRSISSFLSKKICYFLDLFLYLCFLQHFCMFNCIFFLVDLYLWTMWWLLNNHILASHPHFICYRYLLPCKFDVSID